jgi:hypothetical protein
MLDCAVCRGGTSLSPEEAVCAQRDTRAFLASTWRCPSCGKEWSFQEAIIQGLISSNSYASITIVGNILLSGEATVFIGQESLVELTQEVPLVLGVGLTPSNKFARLGWVPAGKDKFIIISSAVTATADQDPGGYAKLGDKIEVDWMLSGRSSWSDLNVPVWQIVLIQAREELDRKGYSLSILSSVAALEALVGTLISDAFLDAGVEKRISDTVFKFANGLTHKIDLLASIAGISLSNSGLRPDLNTAITLRNEIAHGAKAESTESNARWAFEVVVRSIFYLLVQSLTVDATRPAKNSQLPSESTDGKPGMDS